MFPESLKLISLDRAISSHFPILKNLEEKGLLVATEEEKKEAVYRHYGIDIEKLKEEQEEMKKGLKNDIHDL